jgi:tetratricopeptide (TPR) repeat protein
MRRWRRTEQGTGQVALIAAEAGVGKSRLVASFRNRLNIPDDQVVSLQCSPHYVDSAFYPVIGYLERTGDFDRSDGQDLRLDKLKAHHAELVSDIDRLHLIADLLSLPGQVSTTITGLSPQARRQKTIATLADYLGTLARARPILIVVEDVHWVDPSTRQLLETLVERTSSLHHMLILTFRPEFRAPWTGQPHVMSLTLNRLDHGECAELIGRLVADLTIGRDQVEEIIRRTDGVPLFVEEMTRAVLEGASLPGKLVGSEATPAAAPVPAALQASLLARLDRLGREAREIAQIGSAIGREFSHEMLPPLVSGAEPDWQNALTQLVEAGIIYQRGTAPDAIYTFKHALIQDVAYGTLLKSPRRTLHAKIAALLSKSDRQVAPEVLARHYQEAGDHLRAVAFWTMAGDLAEKRAASLEARHYRQGLRLLKLAPASEPDTEIEICMKLGSTLMQSEGYGSNDALDFCRRAHVAAKAAGRSEQEARAVSQMASLLFSSCQHRTVIDAVDSLMTRFPGLPSKLQVQLLAPLGVAKFGAGDLEGAFEALTSAVKIDDTSPCTHLNPIGGGDPAIAARGYAAVVGVILGRFDIVMTYHDEALPIARLRNHPFSIAWALLMAGRVNRLLGDYNDAISVSKEAISICQRYGFPAREATVQFVLGSAQFDSGEFEEGLSNMRSGYELWASLSGRFHASWYLTDFADCLYRADRKSECQSILARAETVVVETDEKSHAAELYRLRGLLLFRDGSVEQARACIHRSLALSLAIP